MAKATKNGAKFESTMLAEGMLYTASAGDYCIELFPYEVNREVYYLATLCCYARPTLSIEGKTAKWALEQLTREAKRTAWTDADFFAQIVYPLARDLNEWIKRPPRETYNSRGL